MQARISQKNHEISENEKRAEKLSDYIKFEET